MKKKPTGYWHDWGNLRKELTPIVESLGRMPSQGELLDRGKSGIADSITRFGGVSNVATRLGVEHCSMMQAEDGHFVQSHNERVVDDLLFAYGVPHEVHPYIIKGSKRRADFKVGDTFIEVFGYRVVGSRGRNYFKRFADKLDVYRENGLDLITITSHQVEAGAESVIQSLRPLIDKHGSKLPSNLEIENAIRPGSWWANWENFRSEIAPITNALKRMPTAIELSEMGKSSISVYMTRYHGGFPQVARRLGLPHARRSPGHFSDWENVQSLLLPICEQLGRMPTCKELTDRSVEWGCTRSATAIIKHWGSWQSVADKLGYPTKRGATTAARVAKLAAAQGSAPAKRRPK